MSPKVSIVGAGIVGLSCAIELQRKGCTVSLYDHNGPAAETSYGNAGVIAVNAIAPYAGPAVRRQIVSLALNRDPAFRLHYPHLPSLLPWLSGYLKRCNLSDYLADTVPINALVSKSLQAHQALMQRIGCLDLLHQNGWLRLYRQAKTYHQSMLEQKLLQQYEIDYDILDCQKIAELEPDLKPIYQKAVWIKQAASISDPGKLGQHYADYFSQHGGGLYQQQVTGIEPQGSGWVVNCGREQQPSDHVVIAAGAWSPALIKPLGYRNPLAIERGYHLHFKIAAAKTLNRSLLDVDCSFVMTPMQQGVRVTSAVELVAKETTPNPVQMKQATTAARQAFELLEPIEQQPWMGRRPCTVDSRPIISQAPRHDKLWFAFGHGHMGLTMGPITGQLIADLICNDRPVVEPQPYGAARLGV